LVEAGELATFIARYPRLLIITGAGISAASGIPTYRDHHGSWLGGTPIQHQEFIEQQERRKRYWARSAVGWTAIAEATPNTAHLCLVKLEQQGYARLLVTQNVDRLHQKAGHQQVIDLHGRLDRVQCLDCSAFESRASIQLRIIRQNPQLQNIVAGLAPDGDANVEDMLVQTMMPPHCLQCDGILMPDVVFFGGAVPRPRVDAVEQMLGQVDGVLVVGSSLMVYSGFRFCRQAHALGLPIALLNKGTTRADELATIKLQADCAVALGQAVNELQAEGFPGVKSQR